MPETAANERTSVHRTTSVLSPICRPHRWGVSQGRPRTTAPDSGDFMRFSVSLRRRLSVQEQEFASPEVAAADTTPARRKAQVAQSERYVSIRHNGDSTSGLIARLDTGAARRSS